jgi:hypothetical protein
MKQTQPKQINKTLITVLAFRRLKQNTDHCDGIQETETKH